MQSERCHVAGILSLPSDDLLKIFSLLSASSLARCCMVCTSWSRIVSNSSLWMNHYLKFKEKGLPLTGNAAGNTKLNFSNIETHKAADWKARYVQLEHRTSFILGSLLVEEWKGHSKRVECCRFKMETIVTGSSDGVVRAWCSTSSNCLATYIVPNKARVVDLEFDENKILAISGTEIYIWNRKEGCLLRHIGGHNQSLHSICYADPEVLVGCSDGTIRVFDIYSGRCARIFRQHTDRVLCIVTDDFASLLMSGSADGTVEMCDYTTGQKICCLLPSVPPTEVHCLHLHQTMLVGGTSRGHVYAWDIRKHTLLWRVKVGPNSITSLHSPSYDATTLVSGSINGMITILDTYWGVILRRFVVGHVSTQSKQRISDKSKRKSAVVEHAGADIDSPLAEIPNNVRPPVLCLRTGMTRIVTSHPDGMIRVCRFKL